MGLETMLSRLRDDHSIPRFISFRVLILASGNNFQQLTLSGFPLDSWYQSAVSRLAQKSDRILIGGSAHTSSILPCILFALSSMVIRGIPGPRFPLGLDIPMPMRPGLVLGISRQILDGDIKCR